MSAAASTTTGMTAAAAVVASDIHLLKPVSNVQLTTTKVVSAAAINVTSIAATNGK